MDAIKRDIAMAEGVGFGLRQQVKALQDSRRDLQARLQQMVPAAELQQAQAETGQLRATIDRLHQEAAAAQLEREQLQASIQVRRRSKLGCLGLLKLLLGLSLPRWL